MVAAWLAEQNFSAGEMQAIDEFRERVREEGLLTEWWEPLPATLPFLRNQKFHVSKAADMFRAHCKWRTEWKLDELVDTAAGRIPRFLCERSFHQAGEIKGGWPKIRHRTDRQGRLICIDRAGVLDPSRVKAAATMEDLIAVFIWEAEMDLAFRFPACSLACGKLITQSHVIVDLAGWRFSHFDKIARTLALRMIQLNEDNGYGEGMHEMTVINTPASGLFAWHIMRPFFSESQRSRISFLGGPNEYMPKLRTIARPEDLPEILGGEDTTCDFLNEQGPWTSDVLPSHLAMPKLAGPPLIERPHPASQVI